MLTQTFEINLLVAGRRVWRAAIHIEQDRQRKGAAVLRSISDDSRLWRRSLRIQNEPGGYEVCAIIRRGLLRLVAVDAHKVVGCCVDFVAHGGLGSTVRRRGWLGALDARSLYLVPNTGGARRGDCGGGCGGRGAADAECCRDGGFIHHLRLLRVHCAQDIHGDDTIGELVEVKYPAVTVEV